MGARNGRLETGDWSGGAQSGEWEIGDWRLEIGDWIWERGARSAKASAFFRLRRDKGCWMLGRRDR